MELKTRNLNIDKILSRFHKIKNTVFNLKKVNHFLIKLFYIIQSNESLLLSLNNNSVDSLIIRKNKNLTSNNSIKNIINNRRIIHSKQTFLNNDKKKEIKTNKTQNNIKYNDIPKNDYFSNRITKGNNSKKNLKREKNHINSARNNNVNNTDLHKFLHQAHNINSTGTNNYKLLNRISLNKYFYIDKIKDEQKSIIDNSTKSIFFRNTIKRKINKDINKEKNYDSLTNINNKYKSNCITRRKRKIIKDNIIGNSNNTCSLRKESGKMIIEDINNNIIKIKKEEHLLKLKSILNDLKSDNNKIKTQLLFLKHQNLKIEKDKNTQNKKIFSNLKNTLNRNINNNNIEIDKKIILNPFKSKIYDNASYRGKIKYIRNVYLDEKLKNSLIEKTLTLYLDSNEVENKKSNIANDSNIDNKAKLPIIWKWIISLTENVGNLKESNDIIKKNIDNLNKENEIYKKYYKNWMKLLGVKTNTELNNIINRLIKCQNINENEEAKMFKILLNKKA